MQVKTGSKIFLAFVVEDLERAVHFYHDVLGFEEIKQVVVHDEKVMLGKFSASGFRFRVMDLGPVGLKLVETKKRPVSTAGVVDDFTGVRYIALVVDDIDATRAELEAKGIEFLSDTIAAEPEQQVDRLVFFRDPDGNLLELYGV